MSDRLDDEEAIRTRFDQCDETCTTDCGHCKGQPVAALLAEIDRLRDMTRLLGPARVVLDHAAASTGRVDCAEMAQRIVDIIGHPVTDEPPHVLAEVTRLRAAVERVRALHRPCPCGCGECNGCEASCSAVSNARNGAALDGADGEAVDQ